MFRGREEIRKQLTELIAKFKEKGATSSEKAITAEELVFPLASRKQCRGGLAGQAFLLK
jgi:hypothetical protein